MGPIQPGSWRLDLTPTLSGFVSVAFRMGHKPQATPCGFLQLWELKPAILSCSFKRNGRATVPAYRWETTSAFLTLGFPRLYQAATVL